jgi:hypothetical protein
MIIFNLISVTIIRVAKAGDGVISDTHGVREKSFLSRRLKNAPACAEASAGRQIRVELAKSRLRGRPCLRQPGEIPRTETYLAVPRNKQG